MAEAFSLSLETSSASLEGVRRLGFDTKEKGSAGRGARGGGEGGGTHDGKVCHKTIDRPLTSYILPG